MTYEEMPPVLRELVNLLPAAGSEGETRGADDRATIPRRE